MALKIGLISDTHSHLDERILFHLSDCDEIWHAGDFGDCYVSDKLSELSLLRGVYGNIDGMEIRNIHPEHQIFTLEGHKIWMTHIGGYPGKYAKNVKDKIYEHKPDIFISGHSHIIKVMKDKKCPDILHLNPGAAGKVGFQKIRSLMKFQLSKEKGIENLQLVELGKK